MQVLNSFRFCQVFRRSTLLTEVQTVCYKSTGKASENIEVPSKPKKPVVAFFRYVQDIKPKLLAQTPNLSQPDVIKAAAEIWNQAADSVKAPFLQAYTVELERYKSDIKEYTNNLTDEQKDYLQSVKVNESERKRKRELKKLAKELGRPIRTPSAFALFLSAMVNKRGNVKITEWTVQLSQQWKIMSEDEKQPYKSKADELRADYKIRMQEWTDEIKKNNDLNESDEEDALKQPPKLEKKPIKNKPGNKSVTHKSKKSSSNEEEENQVMEAEEVTTIDSNENLQPQKQVASKKENRSKIFRFFSNFIKN